MPLLRGADQGADQRTFRTSLLRQKPHPTAPTERWPPLAPSRANGVGANGDAYSGAVARRGAPARPAPYP